MGWIDQVSFDIKTVWSLQKLGWPTKYCIQPLLTNPNILVAILNIFKITTIIVNEVAYERK